MLASINMSDLTKQKNHKIQHHLQLSTLLMSPETTNTSDFLILMKVTF